MTEAAALKRVLVVDDDLSFVAFVRVALEKLGVPSDVALTGGDGIRRLRNGQYAGVLLDLNLPGVTGLEVLRDIRQRGDQVPVVILTGAGTVPAAVEAMRLGAADFLEKPVSLAGLSEAVQTLLALDNPPDLWATGPNRLIDQLAKGMNTVVQGPTDVPTVRAWCVCIGRSESSWYALCEMLGVPAKPALDLARLLRAARCSKAGGFGIAFDAADPRTVARLLKRAGISPSAVTAPTVVELFQNQQLIADHRVVDRVAFYMQRHP